MVGMCSAVVVSRWTPWPVPCPPRDGVSSLSVDLGGDSGPTLVGPGVGYVRLGVLLWKGDSGAFEDRKSSLTCCGTGCDTLGRYLRTSVIRFR